MQFGYNWQTGNLVVGLEADFQVASIKASNSLNVLIRDPLDPTDDATALSHASTKLGPFGTVRGRLGWAAGPTLLYGTFGLAYGVVKDTISVVACDCAESGADIRERFPPLGATIKEEERTKLGYAVGGGGEWLLGQSLSLKAEYQYLDLGSTRLVVFSDNQHDHAEATARFDHRYHTFRVGLNFHFH